MVESNSTIEMNSKEVIKGMKPIKALQAMFVLLAMAGGVVATSGYTAVYDTTDIREAGIDVGGGVLGGLAGKAPQVGSILGDAWVIYILVGFVGAIVALFTKFRFFTSKKMLH